MKARTVLILGAGLAVAAATLRSGSDSRGPSTPGPGPLLTPPPPPPPGQLGYGVPGGKITDPFYRDPNEKKALSGKAVGRTQHLGIDVSTSNAAGGGADDARRGLPVYASVRAAIDISALNAVRAVDKGRPVDGLGVSGRPDGKAILLNAVVLVQPWKGTDADSYGGVVGLACRYQPEGAADLITLYVEWLHLITQEWPPHDGKGGLIPFGDWLKTGKGYGFGPEIREGRALSAAEVLTDPPLLLGYLGATAFPHTHIQVAYASGIKRNLRKGEYPRVDPTVIIS